MKFIAFFVTSSISMVFHPRLRIFRPAQAAPNEDCPLSLHRLVGYHTHFSLRPIRCKCMIILRYRYIDGSATVFFKQLSSSMTCTRIACFVLTYIVLDREAMQPGGAGHATSADVWKFCEELNLCDRGAAPQSQNEKFTNIHQHLGRPRLRTPKCF